MFSADAGEDVERLREALRECVANRIPPREILRLAASPILPSRLPLLLSLPSGLKAYCPAGLLPEAALNAIHIFYSRDYERLEWFTPRAGWRVLDLGAFLGFYTLRACRLVGPGGVVYAVEPLPSHARLISANLRLNSLGNGRLINAAASVSDGPAEIYVPERSINASLVRRYLAGLSRKATPMKVRAVSLDRIVEGAGPFDLVKVDVEGAEGLLLRSRLVEPSHVKRLVVEVHTNVWRPRDLAGCLEERGYSTVIVMSEDTPLQAFLYAY